MAGISAFNRQFFMTDQQHLIPFESYQGRLLRYAMGQAYYDNTVYNHLHAFAQGMKSQQPTLYKYIRTIYNPAYRLAEVYRMNVWGGLLDQNAGDGGAIPIIIGDQALAYETQIRQALAYIFEISNWAANKTVLPLQGAINGDCALFAVDDVVSGQSRIQIIHPSTIQEAETDVRGYVKSYCIVETRLDADNKSAIYTERCEHGNNEDIIFRTFRNDKPYIWPGNESAEWVVPYGFVPLVLIKHSDIGAKWGLSEMHTLMPKVNEVEDLASKLHDQIRKVIENPGLIAGATKKKVGEDNSLSPTGAAPTVDKPEPGREETPMIFSSSADTKFYSLAGTLDIVATSAEIAQTMRDWERDYPELTDDVWGNDARVEGVKTARARVGAKITNRRENYDAGLVRALQMAIAIGGMRGYPKYSGFGLESYQEGKLDFRVDDRPVFPVDVDEDEANTRTGKVAFWEGWSKVANTGVAFKTYARDFGWSDDEIEQAMIDMQEMTGETIPAGGQ